MSVIKACIIAFSTYSKIPMPCFPWKEKDMKYAICFFPLVGLVLGVIECFWLWLCWRYQFHEIMRIMGCIVLSVVVTGGIHLDGYMDTMDALHSYQSRERKLEILKDAHIGAFAVIMLVVYLLVYTGSLSEISWENGWLFGCGFVLSRILSGISVVWFRNAREDGMLHSFSPAAHKNIAGVILSLELLLLILVMLVFFGRLGLVVLLAGVAVFGYYRYKSYKEFGGISGDLAGWFLCLCEAATGFVLALVLSFAP